MPARRSSSLAGRRRHRLERALPERASEHGRVRRRAGARTARARRAGRRAGPGRCRAAPAVVVRLLGDPLDHRLGEQRVSPAALRERRSAARRSRPPPRSSASISSRASSGASGSRNVDRGGAAQRAPARAAIEQLVAGEADLQHRRPQPARQVVDQVERALVGPVDVLPGEHQRLLLGERLEHSAHRPEEALASALLVLLLGWRSSAAAVGAEQACDRREPALGLVGLLVDASSGRSRSASRSAHDRAGRRLRRSRTPLRSISSSGPVHDALSRTPGSVPAARRRDGLARARRPLELVPAAATCRRPPGRRS